MWITSQRNQFRMNINSLKADGKAYTFEYVTVLIYIILGLGITQIITGVADDVHQSECVKLYGSLCCRSFFVFFLQVEE